MSPLRLVSTITILTALSTPRTLAQITEDYVAPPGTTTLDTKLSVLRAKSGRNVTVRDGIFAFRNVTIPKGATVRGVGPNPMIWLVTGEITIDGQLSVDGSDGSDVDTLNSANVPVLGGRGGAAGGSGGYGSPSTFATSPTGDPGEGPYAFPAFGGKGGNLSRGASNPFYGSGGGGGVFTTAGDPLFAAIAQASGRGGPGQQPIGAVPGGPAGSKIFVDARADNDFLGFGYDFFRKQIVIGELPILLGGSGGGGGGDRWFSQNFLNDEKGGGGGGGGGCLVIYALGKIEIGGKVTADGGNGGGGEDAGGCRQGGGGGGGSGGMILLVPRTELRLHVRGETFDKGDRDFVLSADGGVGGHSGWQTQLFRDKYVDRVPRPNAGGFGGLGLIQIVTRPGKNTDNTNTVIDDGIRLVRNGLTLTGAEKTRYLAWRGWLGANGRVDDSGKAIPPYKAGDMRPSPVLTPLL